MILCFRNEPSLPLCISSRSYHSSCFTKTHFAQLTNICHVHEYIICYDRAIREGLCYTKTPKAEGSWLWGSLPSGMAAGLRGSPESTPESLHFKHGLIASYPQDDTPAPLCHSVYLISSSPEKLNNFAAGRTIYLICLILPHWPNFVLMSDVLL